MEKWTPLCGVDIVEDALETYSTNFPTAETVLGDVSSAKVQTYLRENYTGVDAVIGGPPCQGFSKRNMTANDTRYEKLNGLPMVYAKLAVSLQPKVIVMEEVASAQEAVDNVVGYLENKNYAVKQATLDASHYNVPQSRKRIILVATSAGNDFVPPIPRAPMTAKDALYRSPRPAQGDPVSAYARKRILELQKSETRLIGGNYGVMNLDRPSPTIHTQTSSATGPFTIKRGTQYHTMSEEEAARLQSFPASFRFEGSSTSVRRQIGNAVPPMLAKAIAKGIRLR
jgi:site-specific DNA-cytosine methylase